MQKIYDDKKRWGETWMTWSDGDVVWLLQWAYGIEIVWYITTPDRIRPSEKNEGHVAYWEDVGQDPKGIRTFPTPADAWAVWDQAKRDPTAFMMLARL